MRRHQLDPVIKFDPSFGCFSFIIYYFHSLRTMFYRCVCLENISFYEIREKRSVGLGKNAKSRISPSVNYASKENSWGEGEFRIFSLYFDILYIYLEYGEHCVIRRLSVLWQIAWNKVLSVKGSKLTFFGFGENCSICNDLIYIFCDNSISKYH